MKAENTGAKQENFGIKVHQNAHGVTEVCINSALGVSMFSALMLVGKLNIVGDFQLILGSEVTEIPTSAFEDFKGLVHVVFPDGLISIGGGAFSGCTKLDNIVLPAACASVGVMAFSGCTKLDNVVLPAACTSVGVMAFWNCAGLTRVVWPADCTEIADMTFSGCVRLTDFSLPAALTCIGKSAFKGCTGLTSVVFSGKVDIGVSAFEHCQALKSIEFLVGFDCIRANAFRCCVSLREVRILVNSGKIYSYAFQNCTGLSRVRFVGDHQRIGVSVFHGCQNLRQVEFLGRVHIIEDCVFNKCDSLNRVLFLGQIDLVGKNLLAGARGLQSLRLPPNARSADRIWRSLSLEVQKVCVERVLLARKMFPLLLSLGRSRCASVLAVANHHGFGVKQLIASFLSPSKKDDQDQFALFQGRGGAGKGLERYRNHSGVPVIRIHSEAGFNRLEFLVAAQELNTEHPYQLLIGPNVSVVPALYFLRGEGLTYIQFPDNLVQCMCGFASHPNLTRMILPQNNALAERLWSTLPMQAKSFSVSVGVCERQYWRPLWSLLLCGQRSEIRSVCLLLTTRQPGLLKKIAGYLAPTFSQYSVAQNAKRQWAFFQRDLSSTQAEESAVAEAPSV